MRTYISQFLAGFIIIATAVLGTAVLRFTDSVISDNISASDTISTTSTTYVNQTGLSLTPVAGYHWCECMANLEPTNLGTVTLAVAYGGVVQPTSEAVAKGDGGTLSGTTRAHVFTRAMVQADGSTAVTCQWKTSSGTANAMTRNLFISKVGGL